MIRPTLLAAAAAARGGCPTGDDLARGIALDWPGGLTETYRATNQPGIVVEAVVPAGDDHRGELMWGVHLLSFEVTAGLPGQAALDYGIPPQELPVPEPGGLWQGNLTATRDDGRLAETVTHAWGPLSTMTIGPCTFDAIEVAVQSDAAPPRVLEYLPELGLALQIGRTSVEGLPSMIRVAD